MRRFIRDLRIRLAVFILPMEVVGVIIDQEFATQLPADAVTEPTCNCPDGECIGGR